MGLAIRDHGKERTPAETTDQRIGDDAAFRDDQREGFARMDCGAWARSSTPALSSAATE